MPEVGAGAAENDLLVEDVTTPISPRSGLSPRHPGPTRFYARRSHNNFVTTATPPPASLPTTLISGLDRKGIRVQAGPIVAVHTGHRPLSASSNFRQVSASTKRRPGSGRPGSGKSWSTALSLRPSSAPGTRPKAARSPYADEITGWWLMPDDALLRTPAVNVRRPAAEELQQELTMTATVLRTAQGRLSEEREQRLKARASEELAMVDLRRAKDEARAIKEERRQSDRQLTKALMQQRKELEAQLQRQEDEQELRLAQIQAERDHQAETQRNTHEEHTRDLEERLDVALAERDSAIEEQAKAHKDAEERIATAAEEIALLARSEGMQKLEEEREKRVAHLKMMGIRRLIQQSLARGWSAWLEMHQEYQRKDRLLRGAASRLARPKFVACFVHWLRDWEATKLKLETKQSSILFAAELALRQKVEEESEHMRAELAETRKELQQSQLREAELKRLSDVTLDEEKEKRVAHLQHLGVRRLANMSLARGWSAWLDVSREYQRKKRLLRGATGRLARPKLAACFSHWLRDWDIDGQRKAVMAVAQQHAAQVAQKVTLIAELHKQLQVRGSTATHIDGPIR